MPTNSTLPETDDNSAPLSEEEESLSSGNGRLAIIVGVIFLLAIVGYMFMPGEGGRRVITRVMPSVMLGEASVTGSKPAKEPVAPAASEVAAPEEAKPVVGAARPTPRPTAEMGLDSRLVESVAPLAEPAVAEDPVDVAAPAPVAAPTTFTLSGRILDENGRPLAGATVLVKGSRKGTGTDANGNYSLEVPTGENALVYGYGGYEDQEVRTRSAQPVTITLLPAEGTKRRRK
ncbi:MAG: carboxypeptidase-like regulatory domain-containing protein [Hymenobacter sp.]|nr:carboxypeptidase-like regulatory domain-containing protein [Hymenobacter sp.]